LSTITEQKCPCCGGAVEFNVGAQKLKCPFCDTEFEISDMPQVEENNAVEAINWNSQAWAAGETDGMNVYSCKSCGGEIVADAATGATSCPYCGNQVVMKGQFSGAFRPDLIIPFKLDKKAAKEAFKKHLKGKKFVPKGFLSDNKLDEIKGIYVPYWLFTCDAYSQMTFYGEKIKKWSDSNFDAF
jgi:DNA-directed RNA polymerase subunit RPC12/RpoP